MSARTRAESALAEMQPRDAVTDLCRNMAALLDARHVAGPLVVEVLGWRFEMARIVKTDLREWESVTASLPIWVALFIFVFTLSLIFLVVWLTRYAAWRM